MENVMSFQFDRGKKRRDVEGWNCVVFGKPDQIGLTAEEYERIAFDFHMNGMKKQEEECYLRGIRQGSVRCRYFLGLFYEENGDPENAYFWLLEAALGGNKKAAEHLSRR